jgi:Ty3 transposon capsid-like protein
MDPLSSSSKETTLAPSTSSEPERFDGSNYPVEHFLFQLKLFFRTSNQYPSDTSKSLYLLSRLKGQALEWAAPLLESDNPILDNYEDFSGALKRAFSDPDKIGKALQQLSSLRQGHDSAETYASKFTQLARPIPLNELGLVHLFWLGLNGNVKDSLAPLDRPQLLRDMITLAIRVDQRLIDRAKEHNQEASSSYPKYHPTRTFLTHETKPRSSGGDLSPANIQDVWTNLPDKRRRYLTRLALNQCLYCGSNDHQVTDCPVKPSREEGKPKAQSHN